MLVLDALTCQDAGPVNQRTASKTRMGPLRHMGTYVRLTGPRSPIRGDQPSPVEDEHEREDD